MFKNVVATWWTRSLNFCERLILQGVSAVRSFVIYQKLDRVSVLEEDKWLRNIVTILWTIILTFGRCTIYHMELSASVC